MLLILAFGKQRQLNLRQYLKNKKTQTITVPQQIKTNKTKFPNGDIVNRNLSKKIHKWQVSTQKCPLNIIKLRRAGNQNSEALIVLPQLGNTTEEVFKRPKSKTLTMPNAGAEAVEKQKF